MNALWSTHIFVEILPGFDVRTAASQAISLAQETDCEVIITDNNKEITITPTTSVDKVMENFS